MTTTAAALNEFYTFTDKAKNSLIYDTDCIHEDLFSVTMKTQQNEVDEIKLALDKLKTNRKKFIMSLAPQVI